MLGNLYSIMSPEDLACGLVGPQNRLWGVANQLRSESSPDWTKLEAWTNAFIESNDNNHLWTHFEPEVELARTQTRCIARTVLAWGLRGDVKRSLENLSAALASAAGMPAGSLHLPNTPSLGSDALGHYLRTAELDPTLQTAAATVRSLLADLTGEPERWLGRKAAAIQIPVAFALSEEDAGGLAVWMTAERFEGIGLRLVRICNPVLLGATVRDKSFRDAETAAWDVARQICDRPPEQGFVRWGLEFQESDEHYVRVYGPSAGGALAVAFAAALEGRTLAPALVLAALDGNGRLRRVDGVKAKIDGARNLEPRVSKFVLWQPDEGPKADAEPAEFIKKFEPTERWRRLSTAREAYQDLITPDADLLRRFAKCLAEHALGEPGWDLCRPVDVDPFRSSFYASRNWVTREPEAGRIYHPHRGTADEPLECRPVLQVLKDRTQLRRVLHGGRRIGATTAARKHTHAICLQLGNYQTESTDRNHRWFRVPFFVPAGVLKIGPDAPPLPQQMADRALLSLKAAKAVSCTPDEVLLLKRWLHDWVTDPGAEYELVLDDIETLIPSPLQPGAGGEWLRKQLAELPSKVSVLVIARTDADRFLFATESADRWHLTGFAPDDARDRVRNYFQCIAGEHQAAEIILSAALQMPAAEWYGRIPGVLTGLCDRLRKSSPKAARWNQAQVMRAALEVYLGFGTADSTAEATSFALTSLSREYWTTDGPAPIPWDALQRVFSTTVADRTPTAPNSVAGLFVKASPDSYRFESPWVHGFWFACSITGQTRPPESSSNFAERAVNLGVRRWYTAGWKLVWPFVAGLLPPEEGAEQLLNECSQDMLLAATLAAEMDENRLPAARSLRTGLTGQLKAPPDVIRWAAVKALGTLGHRGSIPDLETVSGKDQREEIRRDAAAALTEIARRNGTDVTEVLAAGLEKDASHDVRAACVVGLIASPAAAHTGLLKALTGWEQTVDVTRACAEGLAELGDEAVVQLGDVLVDDRGPAWGRRVAGWALGRRWADGDSLRQLQTFLWSTLSAGPFTEHVAAGAVLGLGRLAGRDAAAVEELEHILTNQNWDRGGFPLVRAAAATALAALGGRAGTVVVNQLRELSFNPDEDHEKEFLRHMLGAAGRTGNEKARETVIAFVNSARDLRVRLAAVSSLALMGATQDLHDAAEPKYPLSVRRAAVRGLAACGNPAESERALDNLFQTGVLRGGADEVLLLCECVEALRVGNVSDRRQLLRDWIRIAKQEKRTAVVDHGLLVLSEFRPPRMPAQELLPGGQLVIDAKSSQQAIRGLINDALGRFETLAESIPRPLQIGFQTYLEEFIGHTTDLHAGTLSLPLVPRLRVATEAVRETREFAYAVSYTPYDLWQGKKTLNTQVATEYLTAFLGKGVAADIRRIYVFKDEEAKKVACREEEYSFDEQKSNGIRLRWLTEESANKLLGKGGILNMLICDATLVTWQYPVHYNARMDGAISVAPYWINELHHCFLTLWKGSLDLFPAEPRGDM